jgi:Cu/Ag efflux pump CusA
MAFAIMGGLLVATLLTLVFLPTLYVAVFGHEKTLPGAVVDEPATSVAH